MIELKEDRLRFRFPELEEPFARLYRDYEEEFFLRAIREDRRSALETYRMRMSPWELRRRGAKRLRGLDRLLALDEGSIREAVRVAVGKVRTRDWPGCEIEFQRTLRLPDDGSIRYLPPGLGRFPVRHVDDFEAKVPPAWLERGGVMMPIYQAEALWIRFEAVYPVAVKVGSGRINAVTGEPWSEGPQGNPQDYLVLPQQPWLDGFAVAPGVIRQFVAAPLGSGETVEEQIAGRGEFGGIQLQVWPMRADAYFRRIARPALPSSLADLLPDLLGPEEPCLREENLCFSAAVQEPSMGLGLGGRIQQEVYRDEFGPEAWDAGITSRCFVHLCNAPLWCAITGAPPPQPPLGIADYEAAGLPWFDHYRSDLAALEGSARLAGLRRIGRSDCADKHGKAVAPGPLVHTGPEDRPEAVRE